MSTSPIVLTHCALSLQTGYASMNQNTTMKATETKMDHVTIKKGSIWAQLADLVDSPFNIGIDLCHQCLQWCMWDNWGK